MFEDLFLRCLYSDFGYFDCIINPIRSSLILITGESENSPKKLDFEHIT
jgi:hypothetical protein